MTSMTRSAIAIVVLFTGCAAALPNAPSATMAGHATSAELDDHRTTHPVSDVTCRDEVPTGTHLERRKCRSEAEREQDRETVRQTFLNPASRAN
jgi:hypothetical protein